MYKAFFGLQERPFQLTPNPRFLYLNPRHREALATLRYALTSSPGITLLLGEAGTGKTTLLRAALHAERRAEHRYVVLSNPTLSPEDFYRILADRFGLPDVSGSKAQFLLAFERELLERYRAGGLTAIIVDEAQSLTHELFEEIRLLANLETATAKLVNVILVGQPELAERLNDPSLRQLKQRIVLRCSLAPLDLDSTASYIATRLQVAGGIPVAVFSKDAVVSIHEASRGIPRSIGVICENALLAGFALQRKPIDRPIVLDVCRGLDLSANGRRPHVDYAAPGRDIEVPDDEVDEPASDAAAPQNGDAAGPSPRRRPSRFWRYPRNKPPRQEPAADGTDAAGLEDRTRIFRFY